MRGACGIKGIVTASSLRGLASFSTGANACRSHHAQETGPGLVGFSSSLVDVSAGVPCRTAADRRALSFGRVAIGDAASI